MFFVPPFSFSSVLLLWSRTFPIGRLQYSSVQLCPSLVYVGSTVSFHHLTVRRLSLFFFFFATEMKELCMF